MLSETYKKLEKNIKIIENPEYKEYVNFSRNFDQPIHRWFDIKEGYSSYLIQDLIKRFDIKQSDFIFDPFCGSGTSLLTAKQNGIQSLGFEINPFLAFLSKIKLKDFKDSEITKLKEILSSFTPKNNSVSLNSPKLSISKKLFGKQLSKILYIKDKILKIKEKNIRDCLLMIYLCILEECSIAKKDGNGLKYPKNKKQSEVFLSFLEKGNQIINDLENKKQKKIKSFLYKEDIRKLDQVINGKYKLKEKDLIYNSSGQKIIKLKNKIALVVFSPPYMNCFDYTEVYKTELWFGDFVKDYSDLKVLRNNSLRSHLNTNLEKEKVFKEAFLDSVLKEIEKKKLWSKKIPLMIHGFFEDMWLTLKGLFNILKKEGRCIIIIGNSAYGNIAVPTDLILANIALKIGFKSCSIEIARYLGTSSQQYKKVKYKKLLRESLVILEK